jgi:predicted metal-dependent phosphotriesterase family hydrolase
MDMVDTVQSVTGPLLPEQLGVTLPHEHVFINMTRTTPQDGYLNVWSEMEDELGRFTAAGGSTLIDKGYQDQILLSQDVCQRSHLRALGGPGYTFLFEEFRTLAVDAGIDPDVLDRIHTVNPRRAIFGE